MLLGLREGQSWPQAMGQLSLLRFGYSSLARSATVTYPLYDFDEYANSHGFTKDLAQFRQWLRTDEPRKNHQRWRNEQGLVESK